MGDEFRLNDPKSWEAVLASLPEGASVNVDEVARLVASVDGSESWELFWETDGETYALVAETASGGLVDYFELAEGLASGPGFQDLAPPAARFVRLMEQFVEAEAGGSAVRLSRMVVAVPIETQLMGTRPSHMDSVDVVQTHLNAMTAGEFDRQCNVRAVRTDLERGEDLPHQYSCILVDVSGTPEDLKVLKAEADFRMTALAEERDGPTTYM